MQNSLSDFAAMLLAANSRFKEAEEEAIVKGCKHITKKAKALIGKENPFWPGLAASTLADKERQGYRVPAPLLREGDLRDSIEWTAPIHEGDQVVGYVGSASKIALYQELGTSKIPPRPFIGLAAQGQERVVQEMMAAHVFSRGFHEWKHVFHLIHKAYDKAAEIFEDDDDNSE
jgi:HK97 gp10 family phage protein